MKKTFLIAICLFIARIAFPQCYFYNTYDYNGRNDGGFSIIQTSTGEFLIAGKSDEPVGIGDGIYVLKADSCGSAEWNSFNILSYGGEEKLLGKYLKT